MSTRSASCRERLVAICALALLASPARAIDLQTVLTRTLENNPAIREARAHLEQATGRRLVLRAVGLPDARLLIPGGVQGGDRAGEKETQPFAFARAHFSQPLFDLAVPPSFRRAETEVLIAQQRLNIAIVEQLHGARIAYYTAAYQEALLELAGAQQDRLQANARAQDDRYEIGQAKRQAVTMARLLEQEVMPRMEESRRTARGARLTLARAMGLPLEKETVLPEVNRDLAFMAVTLNVEEQTRAALRRRADLQLARLLLRAAGEEQQIAEAAYFPQLDLELSGDYIPVSDIRRGSEGSARRSDDIISSEVRAGASYTWRVIDNGKVGGAVARQRAIREMNEIVLAKLEAEVPRELTRLRNTLDALTVRQRALGAAVSLAERTVSDIQANLIQGLSSQLEYRSAETDYLQTRAGLLGVAYRQNVALAELDRVTGRYLQFQDGER